MPKAALPYGDVLRYLRGGADFLLELMNHSAGDGSSSSRPRNLIIVISCMLLLLVIIRQQCPPITHHHDPSAPAAMRSTTAQHQMDRLRRLRTEAEDYYGLHQLVREID